jgi:hypothetical protein
MHILGIIGGVANGKSLMTSRLQHDQLHVALRTI